MRGRWPASLLMLGIAIGFSLSVSAGTPSASSAWFSLPAADQSDWSPNRIARHADLDGLSLGEPIATVAVPALDVAAAVYPDSQTKALEAGAAWVTGTTSPGLVGNVAIAGHRDSFFRPLEDIPLGTVILLSTAETTQKFEVVAVNIVDALDTAPLAATTESMLTLITCHPFRYQGYAPDRYIVSARLVEQNSIAGRTGQFEPASNRGQISTRE